MLACTCNRRSSNILDGAAIAYTDFGTNAIDSVDYPDFAASVSKEVAQGRVIAASCSAESGIGMAIAANKLPGVRAASVTDETYTARLTREHNNANVLARRPHHAGLAGEILAPDSTPRSPAAVISAASTRSPRGRRR